MLIAQSFNAGKSRAKWEGFSFRWYAELFQDTRHHARADRHGDNRGGGDRRRSIATILGTLAAIGILQP